MLKLYNNELIGYCETGISEFGLYGQDTEKVFKTSLSTQPQDWNYRYERVLYDRNSSGHRSKEIKNLDKDFILFLGCSITVGSAVPLEKTFPYIVSKKLNLDYYNLAVEGAGYDLMAHNISHWFKNIKRVPKKIIINWPQEYRTFRIEKDQVIPIGPWNCKDDIGSSISENNWKNFEYVSRTDYFEHYSKIIRDLISSLINVEIIEVEQFEVIDFGRDLKHPGIDTHFEIASSILKSLGQ